MAGGNICGSDQVFPPASQATGSNSFQNPACLPGGHLAYTVWIYGYNGNQNPDAERADIYSLNPANLSEPPVFIGSRNPPINRRVNNVGHIAVGNKIAYACYSNNICVSDLKGGSLVVSDFPGGEGGFEEPVFDSSGTYVAFEWTKSESSDGESGKADICVVPANSLKGRKCANLDGLNAQPDWSPASGSPWVVFQRKDSKGWNLYKIPVQSGVPQKAQMKQITKNGNSTDASWTPDGKKIVYSCDGKICLLDPESGSSSRVATRGGQYFGAVSMCGDGYIYYETGVGDDKTPTAICRTKAP